MTDPTPLVITVRVAAPKPIWPFDGEPKLYAKDAFEATLGREFDGPAGRSRIVAYNVLDNGEAADITLEVYADSSALADLIRNAQDRTEIAHDGRSRVTVTPPAHVRSCCPTRGLEPHSLDCVEYMPARIR